MQKCHCCLFLPEEKRGTIFGREALIKLNNKARLLDMDSRVYYIVIVNFLSLWYGGYCAIGCLRPDRVSRRGAEP